MTQSDTRFNTPLWVVALGRLIAGHGIGRSVCALVAISVLGSMAISYFVLTSHPPEWMADGMAVTLFVSAAISAPVSFVLCHLLADVSRSRAALHRIAHVDALTRAHTRRHFMDQAMALLAVPGEATLVMLDVDHFKQINDRFGHPVGDAVLRAVSDACRDTLRGGDLFARVGGEEFVALLPGADEDTAIRVAERMRLAVADLRITSSADQAVTVTASFGVARRGAPADPSQALDDLLARADKALYGAKDAGRNRILVDGRASPEDQEPGQAGRRASDRVDAITSSAAARRAPDDPAPSSEAADRFRSSPWIIMLGRFVERAGILPATICSVLVSTLASTLLTVIVITAARMPDVGIGIRLSCLLAPLFSSVISWGLFRLVEDVTRARAILRQIAHVDALTQAHTRRYFMDAAPALLSSAPHTAIVLLDIDNFKQINDRHGHATGDRVLRAVSDTCRADLRATDLFARYGGEEFVVMLPGAAADSAGPIIERMRAAIAALQLHAPDGQPIPITASFGIAQGGQAGVDTVDLHLQTALGAADRALYRAKHGGKNRIEFDARGLPPLAPV